MLSRDQILQALTRLAAVLEARGVQGELYLVGGAAIALAYDARRATRDVDAVFAPKQAIYEAAQVVAEELNLPENWLNDAVKLYLRGEDPEPLQPLDLPGLRVLVASPRYLLALKLLASRREDEQDIRTLLNLLQIQSVDEALAVVLQVYPEGQILPKTRFMLEEIFGGQPDANTVEYFYRPHRSSPRIREVEPSLAQLGGTFWVYVRNDSRQPRSVSSIQLNGREIEAIPKGKGLNWYRLSHELIPPRTTALLILNLQRGMLDAAPIELVVRFGDGTQATARLEPKPAPAALASAWLEGRRLTVVVRNDDPALPLRVQRLRVDGRSVRFRALAPEAEPNGGLNFLTATLPRAPLPHQSLPLQVDVRVGETAWMLGGTVRPLPASFRWAHGAPASGTTMPSVRRGASAASILSSSTEAQNSPRPSGAPSAKSARARASTRWHTADSPAQRCPSSSAIARIRTSSPT
jgi:predicted nucleotidyltransferase